jgi:GTP-binding protein
MSSLPTVAIIGRPNVGKSTLFNRMIGQRKAVTAREAGTTRDRLYGQVFWRGKEFFLIDTAGLIMERKKDQIDLAIEEQINIAIQEADLILLVVDGQSGIDPQDKLTARKLRQSEKKVILVINKIDGSVEKTRLAEFYGLGMGEPLLVSALHGKRSGDLLDLIINNITLVDSIPSRETMTTIAIIGQPNVGKSTLLNQLVGFKRAIVNPSPGTTRDALETTLEHGRRKYLLIDTAGIRRQAKIKKGVEQFSMFRALKSIIQADLVILLVDAQKGLVHQDAKLGQLALEAKKKLIVAINKSDLIKPEKMALGRFPFLSRRPIIFISALTGKNINRLLELINQLS